MLPDFLKVWYNYVTDLIVLYAIQKERDTAAMNEKNENLISSPEQQTISVPFIAHEGAMARMERANKRIAIIAIIAILAFVISNFAWLHAWMQYDYGLDHITVETSSEGNANYIARDGEINNASN